jgi:hypothetical protein
MLPAQQQLMAAGLSIDPPVRECCSAQSGKKLLKLIFVFEAYSS